MAVMEKFSLVGQRALVTGGGRGLGLEMARALAEAGARIVIAGRGAESLEAAALDLAGAGIACETIVADMSRPEDCERTAATALAGGPIDILVNNVGGRVVNVPIEQTSIEQWREAMALNLDHYFFMTRRIGEAMISHGKGGRIINTASISGQIVNRDVGGRHYETAKAAVLQFTRAVAADWACHGITANTISPGLFMTDANRRWEEIDPKPIDSFIANVPMGRAGRPEEIGPLALFLASAASSYVTGADFVIDGGYTVL